MAKTPDLLKALFIALMSLFIPACQPSTTDNGQADMLADNQTVVAPMPIEGQDEYWQAWRQSAHGNTYALEKGPNTYCARCHSPLNWDPEATIDTPPNCVSCKFPNEPEPRVAAGNPLVVEQDWQNIGCVICHPYQDERADAQLIWLNTQTGYQESVADVTDLCSHCHADTETLRHARSLGDEAHKTFTCVDCHDPHSLKAGCSGSDCHVEVAIPFPELDTRVSEAINEAGSETEDRLEVAHSAAHANVACVACHDAGGLEVGPAADGNWGTFRTVELLGRTSTEPYQSHQLKEGVDCSRCHFPANPWDLPEDAGGATDGQ